MRQIRFALLALALFPASALAHKGSHAPDPNLHVDPRVKDCEVRFAPELTQPAFERFVREFGSVSAFKQMAPPQTLGRRGILVGLEYMSFHVDEHSDAWNDTFTHPEATHELGSDLAFPKLKLRVGLTENTDVGLFFAKNPTSNYGWIGLDAQHAFLRESAGRPVTLAVRGAYTKTLFVDDMDMHALSAGVSVGRTWWDRLTPYAGTGADLVLARETSPAVELTNALEFVPNAFAGVNLAFWYMNVGAEAQLGAISTAQMQLSARF